MGAVFAAVGLGFFSLAWSDRSIVPVAMGLVTVAFGVFMMSIRATLDGGLEYGLFRLRR